MTWLQPSSFLASTTVLVGTLACGSAMSVAQPYVVIDPASGRDSSGVVTVCSFESTNQHEMTDHDLGPFAELERVATRLRSMQVGWDGAEEPPPSARAILRAVDNLAQHRGLLSPTWPVHTVADVEGGVTVYIYGSDATNNGCRFVSMSFPNDEGASILFFDRSSEESDAIDIIDYVVSDALLQRMLHRIG